jgi:glycosyltransferase involved in cell wall biosynthesis
MYADKDVPPVHLSGGRASFKVHICFLCSEYPPAPHGGIGSFTQTVAREYVKAGHQVTVVGAYPIAADTEDTDEGVRIMRIAQSRRAPLFRVFHNRRLFASVLDRLHAQPGLDIVEGGELDMGMLNPWAPGCKVLRMHGGPHFFSYAAGRKPGVVAIYKERLAFRVANQLCAVSHYVADTTRELLKLGDRKITVIPNPVDLDAFHPAPAELEQDGLIVFTGTITERKGIRQLVQAMPAIRREIPNARLEVYGGDALNDADAAAWTKALKDSVAPEVAAEIDWKGRVQRPVLSAALQRASVCVYPSHMEAMPIGWLEGLATGKAVVASRTGPGPELIRHGVNGLLCDPYDPASIAAEIVRVLKDRPLRRQLGETARRTCVELYSLPMLIKTNLAWYEAQIRGGKQ